jgi:hypothetical protein
MTGLRVPRRLALVLIACLVLAATAASFAESYRALYVWAGEHGLSGVWQSGWPIQVDVFIGVGELALFVALCDGWSFRSRLMAWSVTLLGLAASVLGNVGHVAGQDIASRGTAAVPPLAAFAALSVGLGLLKRIAVRQPVSIWGQPGLVPAERKPVKLPAGRQTPRPSKAARTPDKAAAIVARQPDISGAQLGRSLGMSDRTGRRMLAGMNGAVHE